MPGELPPACQAVAGDLPELALGVLPGRERAAALAHLDTCDPCRAEVERLSLVADGVLRATPRIDPPDGFEQRVLAKMGRPGDRRRAAQQRLRRQRRLVLSLAAAVVALAVPLGLALSQGANAPVTPAATHLQYSAPLVSHGTPVGHVWTFSSHGTQPAWLSMTIHRAGGTGWVRCQVTVRDGAPVTVGTFWLDGGSGRWDAALPVAADDVTGARVLADNSSVVATAHFS